MRVLRDPPTTGTNKIVKRTLVHQKFRPDRVERRRCSSSASAATTPTGRSDRPTPTALARLVHPVRARAVLGSLIRGPLVHRGGGRLRDGDPRVVGAQPRPSRRASRRSTTRSSGAGRGRPKLAADRWVGIHWPDAYGGRGASPVQVAIFNMEYARSRRAPAGEPGRHQPRRPDAARARHRRAEAALVAADPHARPRSGASCSASPTPAPTSRR